MVVILRVLLSVLAKVAAPILWLAAPFALFVFLAYNLMHIVRLLLDWGIGAIDSGLSGLSVDIPSVDMDSVASDVWAGINLFIDLNLMFGLMTTLFSLYVVMTVVRIVKSFIPTIA